MCKSQWRKIMDLKEGKKWRAAKQCLLNRVRNHSPVSLLTKANKNPTIQWTPNLMSFCAVQNRSTPKKRIFKRSKGKKLSHHRLRLRQQIQGKPLTNRSYSFASICQIRQKHRKMLRQEALELQTRVIWSWGTPLPLVVPEIMDYPTKNRCAVKCRSSIARKRRLSWNYQVLSSCQNMC